MNFGPGIAVVPLHFLKVVDRIITRHAPNAWSTVLETNLDYGNQMFVTGENYVLYSHISDWYPCLACS
jgi:hypothetical protein